MSHRPHDHRDRDGREDTGVELIELFGGPFDGHIARVAPGSTEVRASVSDKPCPCCSDMLTQFAYRPPGYPGQPIEPGETKYVPAPVQQPGKRRRFIES